MMLAHSQVWEMEMLSRLRSHLTWNSLAVEPGLQFTAYQLLSCKRLCSLVKIKVNALVLYILDKRYLRTQNKNTFAFVIARFLQ